MYTAQNSDHMGGKTYMRLHNEPPTVFTVNVSGLICCFLVVHTQQAHYLSFIVGKSGTISFYLVMQISLFITDNTKHKTVG